MSQNTHVLAFDFGASSGRAIKANYDGTHLTYQEIHRFENVPIEINGTLCWDFDMLMQEIRTGIDKAGNFDSIAFDTWGVDFGLLNAEGTLLKNPVHYRDPRTASVFKEAFNTLSPQQLYSLTGNQLMPLNTLFQLLCEDLSQARTLLFMPDLFGYMLCKNAVCELSIASTSQMLSPLTKKWSPEVLKAFSIPPSLFAPLVESGSIIGTLENGAKVISVAGHDTQCAVAAMPCLAEEAAFLSCGTWSLLGCELESPVLSRQSLEAELSNEQGANGRVNYLKNIIGLWLIQESRREWGRQGKTYSYADLERLALEAAPFQSFINPDAPVFSTPGDIPGRVQQYCRTTAQPVPQSVGGIMRCIYQSLALKYRHALEQISQITAKQFNVLHVLGGGAKDNLLCQMTANSCGILVKAGPIEATALGNILIQLVALGKLDTIAKGRELIAATQKIEEYHPLQPQEWNTAYLQYTKLLQFEKESLT